MRRAIEELLIKWKDSFDRLPLIFRGARQVGKSFIIEKFGKSHFESLVTLNFEKSPSHSEIFDNTLDPKVICTRIQARLSQNIIPGKTLLFLDEIQNCPNAILALRYFKEELGSLHVIAAGSLLEFALHEENFSFPVGRVQFIYLRPLSFREYLTASKKDVLSEYCEKVNLHTPVDPVLHNAFLDEIRKYFLTGGMPAALNTFLNTGSLSECEIRLRAILETYKSDFSKYATKAQHKYLQIFFNKAPALVCQQFMYSHIDPELRSRELKVALEQLEWAGLLSTTFCTNASGIPLYAHIKEHKFKLLFLDIGLLNIANQLSISTIWDTQLIPLTNGTQAEQFVGQELLAYENCFTKGQLFYWERDKKGSSAEVDYVIQVGKHIIPVEVKAGTTGRLRSLAQFMAEKKPPFGIRISQHSLSYRDGILSIPFYLIDQIPKIVELLTS